MLRVSLSTTLRSTIAVGVTALAVACGGTLMAPRRIVAQEVSGRVVDAMNGSPVADASLALLPATGVIPVVRATTSGDGTFRLDAPGVDLYRLEVSRLGYGTALSEPFEVTGSVDVVLTVRPLALGLEEMEVTVGSGRGRDEFERRREEWGKGVFLTPDSVAALDPMHPADLLAAVEEVMVRWGMGVTDAGERRLIPDVRPHAGNGCMAYLVDGRPARPPPWSVVTPWAFFPLSAIRGEDVAAAEVYRSISEAPAELRAAGARTLARVRPQVAGPLQPAEVGFPDEEQCGVTVFWTKAGW